MGIKVSVDLSGSLLQSLFSNQDIVHVYLCEDYSVKHLCEKMQKMADCSGDKESLLKEHFIIINCNLVENSHILKDGDEVVILPWLIGG